MYLHDYQTLASRTAKPLERSWDLAHGGLGICSEAGELATTIKAHLIYNKPLDKENIAEEIGDCLWFLARICEACDITLSRCAAENIAKLQARYPEAYSDEDALERKDKVSSFGLAPILVEGTVVCSFCRFPPEQCVCKAHKL